MKLKPIFCALLFILSIGVFAESDPPNVVLILVDDYGYADIGFEGNTAVQTPNIDRIANEGTHFTRFYQCAGACAPTRASLLTGRYLYENGVWGVHWGRDFIHRDEHTLGDLLQGVGYKTGVFGKWHSGKTNAYFGWSRGFDTSVHTKLYDYWNTFVLKDNMMVSVEGGMTDVVGDEAVKFIVENQNRPFFCYIPFQAVHEPFNAPAEVFQKYKDKGLTDHVARLYAMIEVVDDNIGKVLNKLDELHLSEDTVVMFLVDDGPADGFDLSYSNRRMNADEKAERESAWGRKLRGGKANIWEGGQISPFYVRWPGKVPVGQAVDVLSGVIDLYPTLAAICGAEYPDGQLPLRGVNLLPSFLGEEQNLSERYYFDGKNLYLKKRKKAFQNGVPRIPELSVHYKNYKYVREDQWVYQNKDFIIDHLYDLDKDPLERNNIAREHPQITQQLREKTELWFDDIMKSGRAFKEAVYPVGCWDERGTPINLDATVAILGTLERDPGSGFFFTNWTEVGNGLSFSIDVLEAGSYEVEFDHENPTIGTKVTISADNTSVTGSIGEGEYSTISGLRLEEGEQTLTITLSDLNGAEKAMDWLRLITVRRVADEDDDVLNHLGFEMTFEDENRKPVIAERRDETREFMFPKENHAIEIVLGEAVQIQPIADNLRVTSQITAYLGFDKIGDFKLEECPLVIRPANTGLQTLNLVFETKSGIRNSVRVDLQVRDV